MVGNLRGAGLPAVGRAGVQLEQRAKGMFGSTRGRTLNVSAVDDGRRLEFTGTMGPSALRWGFDLAPIDANQIGVMLWVEIEPKGPMRAVPGGLMKATIRRVNERELVAIKSAIEATMREEHTTPGT